MLVSTLSGELQTACESSDCLSIGTAALRVTVVKSRTQVNALPGATVVFANGSVTDSVVVASTSSVSAVDVGANAGTSTITIRKAGFNTATRSNVGS